MSADEFVWSVKNGQLEKVKAYVDSKKGKFDVNAQITGGRSPIHFAADYGQEEVIDYLVKQGANVNLPDAHGITPLLCAIWEGHPDCVKFLISKGAKKDGKSPDGVSYLDCAETSEIKDLLK
ncbi:PREDICTED: myotrophin-like [Amphimedon queenslandica]|uniref:Uncharacterized protein n=1 Tax=Amphimedon queenslandica TaxID=400682 RepID=A0A1X7V6R6_AMPQE|nr:PREDICTED: myotrophin-like [Amphimedon queenslandica]|eukprot:XP_003385617.1 PREDICTED: myotrophin-like [Amphimedon queenslandica]